MNATLADQMRDWPLESVQDAYAIWERARKVAKDRKDAESELKWVNMRNDAAAELLARKLRE